MSKSPAPSSTASHGTDEARSVSATLLQGYTSLSVSVLVISLCSLEHV